MFKLLELSSRELWESCHNFEVVLLEFVKLFDEFVSSGIATDLRRVVNDGLERGA